MTAALLLLISCGHVQIKDQVWYADKGQIGATEFHTLESTQRRIMKSDWDSMRMGMLCTPISTFAEIKKEFEQLCSYYQRCEYPESKQLLNMISRMQEAY